MKVIKRNGETVDFDRSKIITAIQKANGDVFKGTDQLPFVMISDSGADFLHRE